MLLRRTIFLPSKFADGKVCSLSCWASIFVFRYSTPHLDSCRFIKCAFIFPPSLQTLDLQLLANSSSTTVLNWNVLGAYDCTDLSTDPPQFKSIQTMTKEEFHCEDTNVPTTSDTPTPSETSTPSVTSPSSETSPPLETSSPSETSPSETSPPSITSTPFEISPTSVTSTSSTSVTSTSSTSVTLTPSEISPTSVTSTSPASVNYSTPSTTSPPHVTTPGPQPGDDTVTIVSVVSATIFVVILTATIGIVYVKRYKGNQKNWFYFRNQNVFGGLNADENENEYEYDAFISFCEHDRSWVYTYLVPKLERAKDSEDYGTAQSTFTMIICHLLWRKRIDFLLFSQIPLRSGCAFTIEISLSANKSRRTSSRM